MIFLVHFLSFKMSIFLSISTYFYGEIISSAAIITSLSSYFLLMELISANDIPPNITITNLCRLNLIMSSFSSSSQVHLSEPNSESSNRFFLGFYPDRIYSTVGTTSSRMGVCLSRGMLVRCIRSVAMVC